MYKNNFKVDKMLTYKCVLLGDDGFTKKTFLERLLDGGYSLKEVTYQDVDIRPLVFYTTRGPIRFNVWDAAGEDKFEMLRQGPIIPADCVIVLYDNQKSCYGKIQKAYKDKPTIICGRKGDLMGIIKKKTKNQYFFDISSPNTFNFVYPFLWLGAQLLGDMVLEVVQMPALMPEGVKLTKEQRLQMEMELEEARVIPLPEE